MSRRDSLYILITARGQQPWTWHWIVLGGPQMTIWIEISHSPCSRAVTAPAWRLLLLSAALQRVIIVTRPEFIYCTSKLIEIVVLCCCPVLYHPSTDPLCLCVENIADGEHGAAHRGPPTVAVDGRCAGIPGAPEARRNLWRQQLYRAELETLRGWQAL